jgi:hypothetical protein
VNSSQTPTGFATDTLVHTKNGTKPIQHIEVGDEVLSFPDDKIPPSRMREESELLYVRVVAVASTPDQPLNRLLIDHLATGERDTLLLAAQQPVFVTGEGWRPALQVGVMSVLENHYFGNLMLSRNHEAVATGVVHRLTLEALGSFYVGPQGVWVHE